MTNDSQIQPLSGSDIASKIREALEFYASDEQYENGQIIKNEHGFFVRIDRVIMDAGDKAKEALPLLLQLESLLAKEPVDGKE